MPGVANSTMKCPSFSAFVPAMALRPWSAIHTLPAVRTALPGGFPYFAVTALASQTRSQRTTDLPVTSGALAASNSA